MPVNTRDNFGTSNFFELNMNFLKQVIDLLSKYEQNIDVFDEHVLENTALARLYNGVKNGDLSTDDDSANDIYRNNASDPRYRNLKSRLKKKLANHLFFLKIEQPQYSESLAEKYEINRQLFVVKTLSDLGAGDAAYEVASQLYVRAIKFHLTEETINCLLFLQNYASSIGKVRDQKKYSILLRHYIEIQLGEIAALEKLQWLKLLFIQTKSVHPTIIKKAEIAVKEIRDLRIRYKSFTLFLVNFRIEMYFHQLKGDYVTALDVCKNFKDFFDTYPHLSTHARLIEIASYKNLCYLYLRRYEEGIEHSQNNLPLLREGGGLWFGFMEEYFLLNFQGGSKEEANKVYSSVVNHISFTTLPAHRKETWEIFGLYLSFVEGKGNPDMDKFMKDMEVFRYDKSGVYVAVLALSILILLRNGDYPTILNRNEYLKKYLTRYLKGDDHVRSAAFFRLLRLMIRKEFNLPQILKAGAKDIAVLHDQSLRLDDYEVMPYEKMWDIVVEVLEEKARTSHDIPL